MARERQVPPIEKALDEFKQAAHRQSAAVEAQTEALAQNTAVVAQAVKLLAPEPPRYAPGQREPVCANNDGFLVLNVPLLQLAFRREVPKRAIQSHEPGLAVVDCPCGAVVNVAEGEYTACLGPEGGECPRLYLNAGRTVHVANVDMLEDEWKDRECPPAADLEARRVAEALERGTRS